MGIRSCSINELFRLRLVFGACRAAGGEAVADGLVGDSLAIRNGIGNEIAEIFSGVFAVDKRGRTGSGRRP